MTVIAVASSDTACWMASDSRASCNGAVATLAEPKIMHWGDVLIGCEGSFAVLDFCRYVMPKADLGQGDLSNWLAMSVVPQLRAYLTEVGAMRRVNERPEFPGQILVAHKDWWRIIDTGGHVIRFASHFWAIGSGAPEARGAMHAHGLTLSARRLVEAGVVAACALDDGCAGPIHVLSTEQESA